VRVVVRANILLAAALLGVASGAGGLWLYHHRAASPRTAVFVEADWPLPKDQWGKGKFFHCDAGQCGVPVDLYVRAKIGFCKCDVGVDDDDELDRVSDVPVFVPRPRAEGPGRVIAVAWMKGRSRKFVLSDSLLNGGKTALAIAFNDKCDVVVATLIASGGEAQQFEMRALAFLNSDAVMDWAKITLGL
jgi:hypothetical protein